MTASISPAVDCDVPLASESIRRVTIGPEVESRLRRSGYLALQDVSCDVRAGIVRLHGQLPTYYLMQIAQEVAGEVEGVRSVLNQIEVVAPDGTPAHGARSSVGGSGSVRPDRMVISIVEGLSPSEHREGSRERCWF